MKKLLLGALLFGLIACGDDSDKNNDNNTANNANNMANNANNMENNANNGATVGEEECLETCVMRAVTDCGAPETEVRPICESNVCYEPIPSDFHTCLEDVPCGTLEAALANGSGVCGITPN